MSKPTVTDQSKTKQTITCPYHVLQKKKKNVHTLKKTSKLENNSEIKNIKKKKVRDIEEYLELNRNVVQLRKRECGRGS